MQGHGCKGQYGCCAICRVHYTMCQSMQKGFGDAWRSTEFSMQGHTLTPPNFFFWTLYASPAFKGLALRGGQVHPMDNPPTHHLIPLDTHCHPMAPSTWPPTIHFHRPKGHSIGLIAKLVQSMLPMLPKVAHGGLNFSWWYDKISYAPALSTVRPFCRQAILISTGPRPLLFHWLS